MAALIEARHGAPSPCPPYPSHTDLGCPARSRKVNRSAPWRDPRARPKAARLAGPSQFGESDRPRLTTTYGCVCVGGKLLPRAAPDYGPQRAIVQPLFVADMQFGWSLGDSRVFRFSALGVFLEVPQVNLREPQPTA